MNLLTCTFNTTYGTRDVKNNILVSDNNVKQTTKKKPESFQCFHFCYNLFPVAAARIIFLKTNPIMSPSCSKPPMASHQIRIKFQVTTPWSSYMTILCPPHSPSAPATLASPTSQSCQMYAASSFLHYTGKCLSSQILMAHALLLVKILLIRHSWKAFYDHFTQSFSHFELHSTGH